jgi:hypothetical protein
MIHVDPVELDDGHAHRYESASMRFERLVADEEIDVPI